MPHPRTSFFDSLRTLSGSSKSMGYRMPAEWEPMKRIWLTFPHNDETWPGCLGRAMEQYRAWIAAMEPYVNVTMTQQLPAGTNDSWIRDYGPIFVIDDKGNKIAHDFHFNGWGGKYETRDLDDVIPQHVARFVGVPLILHDLVLEGGSIDVNGKGTVLTTEQCLLNTNRNPHLSREAIVRELHEALGTTHVVWLPGGIIGDDTDGHIDDIARFVSADTVVGLRAPIDHPDAAMLNLNWDALQNARDQDGKKLNLIELPVPEPILYDFPADRFGPGGLNPVPASYANFLIANGGVFVPIFGQKSDDVALRTLERAMPHHRIIGLRADALVVGLGSFHCLSQQEPK